MKKKMNRRFIEIALFSIIIATVAVSVIFYMQLRKQVLSDLKILVDVISVQDAYEKTDADIRITVIERDGTVSFDSAVDEGHLENHMNRPEVKKAFETGEGKGVRESDSLSVSVYYYARQMKDGRILRVGKEAQSVNAVLLSAFSIVIVLTVIIAVVCMIVSQYLTIEIMKPINDIAGDLDHIDENELYPELIPFTRKIRSQHEEILRSANMRQEFTANVSHELKTPLAAISGYAELMESGMACEADVKHFSEEIRKSASRLLSLINDIIKLSQLDEGKADGIMEHTDIAEIARETVDMLGIEASKKKVVLSYEGIKSAMARGGRELTQELVYNLVENAIQYNKPNGSVHVYVFKRGGKVVFSVKDDGIGIPKEHQERIFERFYRVDKSRSKELGGTGLGLAIVKHICTLTGGKISVQSEVNIGTQITVSWKI